MDLAVKMSDLTVADLGTPRPGTRPMRRGDTHQGRIPLACAPRVSTADLVASGIPPLSCCYGISPFHQLLFIPHIVFILTPLKILGFGLSSTVSVRLHGIRPLPIVS